MKYALIMLCAVAGLCSCRALGFGSSSEECDPFHIAPTPAKVPAVTASPAAGRATLVGSAADSATGGGVRSAVVVVVLRSLSGSDSTGAYTDTTGGFTLGDLRPGQYRYSLRSVNFRQRRGSIDVRSGIDTLRVVLTRGLPICKVTLTHGP